MISTNLQRIKYIAADYFASLIAVVIFNIVRFNIAEDIVVVHHSVWMFIQSRGVWLSILIFPLVMIGINALSGYYVSPIHRSRADEFIVTLLTTAIGTIVFFFGALLNDANGIPFYSYEMMMVLFAVLFTCVYTGRFMITSHAARMISQRIWSYNMLIVGDPVAGARLEERLMKMKKPMGYTIVGYVDSENVPEADTTVLGHPLYSLDDIDNAVKETDAKGLIIVMKDRDKVMSMALLNRLYHLELPILVTTDHYGALMSRNRFSNIAGEPLINLSGAIVSDFTVAMKRFCDIVFSLMALILTSPVIAVLALAIKIDSRGPVFYSQERIGRYGRPFHIHKLRSMSVDAECDGPALSTEGDSRVTKVGYFMRKYRLDEFPNFWNVLCGEMSLVGPRPERAYFIDQIVKIAPVYTLLHQIRPGITSWGMVKYGYASTVEQMIERMKYDIIYLGNISVSVDIKIMFYTIRTVVTGQGV